MIPPRAPHRPLVVSAAAATVVAVGVVVLVAGWWADLEWARGPADDSVTRPTTALALTLLGLGAWWAVSRPRRATVVCVVAAVATTTEAVAQALGGSVLDPVLGASPGDPGAVGLFTAVFVAGLAVVGVLVHPGRWRSTAEALALAVAGGSGILALAWGLAVLEGLAIPSATAPVTSAALLLAALAWLRVAAVGGGLVGPLTATSVQAASMRRLVAAVVVLVAALLVAVRLAPGDGPLADPSVRSAVIAGAVLVVVTLVAARLAAILTRVDADLRRSEARLREANTDLEQRVADRTRVLELRNRDLEHFANAAAHDLLEPLRAITGYASLLSRHLGDDLDDTGRRYVDVLGEAVGRQRQLLGDLLQLARVQQREAVHDEIDLHALLADVALDLEAALAAADLDVAGRLPVVRTDRVLVSAALRNLLVNAAKFHLPGTRARIEVAADREPHGWWLSVRDHGIGIAPEHRERIWRPFQRLHTRDEYPGTGVGLGIVRSAVDRLGGEVAVVTPDGDGTCFVLHVPEAPARGACPAGGARLHSADSGGDRPPPARPS